MAGEVYDIEVDGDTPREALERVIIAAQRTSDSNVQRVAALAKTEIARREREEDRQEWQERFDAVERARAKAQQFQEGQNTRLIEAQEKLMDKQTKVADRSATAAMWSAIATIVIAGLTVFLVWAAFKAID